MGPAVGRHGEWPESPRSAKELLLSALIKHIENGEEAPPNLANTDPVATVKDWYAERAVPHLLERARYHYGENDYLGGELLCVQPR